ncbi:hypothetical protein JCM8547_008782 [Rhodosporidiobolus lusitaniae]
MRQSTLFFSSPSSSPGRANSPLPPLPPPPSHLRRRSLSLSRPGSSLSRGRAGTALSDTDGSEDEAIREYLAQARGRRERSEEEEMEIPTGLGMFSRRARSAARTARQQQRTRSLSQPETFHAAPPSLPSSPPLSPSSSSPEPSLFAPSLSSSRARRLSRASEQLQAHETAQRKKAEKLSLRGEMEVARGLVRIVKQKARSERGRSGERGEGHGRSKKRGGGGGRTSLGRAAGEGGEEHEEGLVGLVQEVEGRFFHPSPSASVAPVSRPSWAPAQCHPDEHEEGGADFLKKGFAAAGGMAGLVGIVGAGFEWWEHEKAEKKRRGSTATAPSSAPPSTDPRSPYAAAYAPSSPAPPPHPAILPASVASTLPTVTSPSRPPSSLSVPRPPSIPLPLPTTRPPNEKVYLSTLTPREHKLVQHAAAALLLKDKSRGTLHEGLHEAVGGVERMVRALESGVEEAVHGVRRHKQLFGTPLAHLTHHEGVNSHHGLDPNSTIRVPEFVDHCITALMRMDCTVPGILRKSGNLRTVMQIVDALNESGGNGKDTVIDLAALDPITLADIFKRFLAALPHPILTGHLFKLFIACSHIHHPNLRRRSMHLVICMMPKVNRDVLEVVFLFLDWLSQHAHVDLEYGNQMDLSNIARVMAPTLLRPGHRDPKPVEVSSMIAAVLNLLEDQHVLHEIPYELSSILHIQAPPEHVHGDSAALLQHLAKML